MAQSIADLRALVAAERRKATRKVSRNRTVKNIELGGSVWDVRRDPNAHKRYTRAQLASYLNDLTTFNSRATNFHRSVSGKPIPVGDWREYKTLERQYNNKGNAYSGKYDDVFIPQSNMTIGQRNRLMTPDNPKAAGQANAKPFQILDRYVGNIDSPKALAKLTANMRKKLKSDYLPKVMLAQRKQALEIFTTLGVEEHKAALKKLTPEQFYVLWNETKFANSASAAYNVMSASNMNWAAKVMDDYSSDLGEMLQWAGNLKFSAARGKRTQRNGNGK